MKTVLESSKNDTTVVVSKCEILTFDCCKPAGQTLETLLMSSGDFLRHGDTIAVVSLKGSWAFDLEALLAIFYEDTSLSEEV